MTAYFSLTIALIYILKPVRNALFLEELGSENLRYVYMAEGVSLAVVAASYIWLSKRMHRKNFFVSTLLFFASNLVFFHWLFEIKAPWLSAYFYIWVSAFSITSTTQFWIIANDIFKPEQAKRLFGLIISGGSLGGILGGLGTGWIVKRIPTESLLFLGAGILVVCAMLIAFFWKQLGEHDQTAEEQLLATRHTPHPGSWILTHSSYLMMLAGVVLLAKMSSAIIDNQFNRIVEIGIVGKAARTAFLANFMAWMNVASLICQLCLTSLALRFLGVRGSLSVLPLGLALFSVGSLFCPMFVAGTVLKVFDGSINYSLQQAGKEMLFLPLSSRLRYKVKPVIDMLGFRVAKSLSGVYIAIFAPMLGLADERLGVLVLFLLPVWLFLVWHLHRHSPLHNQEKTSLAELEQGVGLSL